MVTATRKLADAAFKIECFKAFTAGYVSGIDMLKKVGRKKREIEQILGGKSLFCPGWWWSGRFLSLTLSSVWLTYLLPSRTDHSILSQIVTHRENVEMWTNLLADNSNSKKG